MLQWMEEAAFRSLCSSAFTRDCYYPNPIRAVRHLTRKPSTAMPGCKRRALRHQSRIAGCRAGQTTPLCSVIMLAISPRQGRRWRWKRIGAVSVAGPAKCRCRFGSDGLVALNSYREAVMSIQSSGSEAVWRDMSLYLRFRTSRRWLFEQRAVLGLNFI